MASNRVDTSAVTTQFDPTRMDYNDFKAASAGKWTAEQLSAMWALQKEMGPKITLADAVKRHAKKAAKAAKAAKAEEKSEKSETSDLSDPPVMQTIDLANRWTRCCLTWNDFQRLHPGTKEQTSADWAIYKKKSEASERSLDDVVQKQANQRSRLRERYMRLSEIADAEEREKAISREVSNQERIDTENTTELIDMISITLRLG